MYLSKRNNTLLHDFLVHPRRTNKELQNIYNLSRRQVDYSISKLNYWLEEKAYPPIVHTSSGNFFASPKLVHLICGSNDKKVNDWYISSQKERCYVIILMIITNNEVLNINHFMPELGVSRNTVIRDLKRVKEIVANRQLQFGYFRKEGYIIKGKEWDQRFVLIKIINHFISALGAETYLQHFMGITEDQVISWRQKVERVEDQLKLKFTDIKMQVLPYILESIFKRIDQGKTIENIFFADYEGLSDTREYSAVEFLIQGRGNVSKQERMYITLQVLTSNVIPSTNFIPDKVPFLEQSLNECLNLFEQNACVTLKNKKALIKKLIIHFKPAFYRIKYHLTTDYSSLKQISQEYKVINSFVKQSVGPLERLLGEPIPETEILFISLFIGSHLIDFGSQFHKKLKAVVVCTNGVSMSLLMEETLKGLFPEMMFSDTMSVREYEHSQNACDVVFSTIPIHTKAKLFIVNEVMNEEEKRRLKHDVIKEIYNVNNERIDVDELMNIIKKYADVQDVDRLRSSFSEFLTRKMNNREEESGKDRKTDCQLYELLPIEMIQQINKVDSWGQALELAAKPLLHRNIITGEYLNRMELLYKKPLYQILLGRSILLPHAEPQYGVNQLGMSLLHIREGIQINQSLTVFFVVILAAVDKKRHLTALLELTKIAQSNECIEALKTARGCNYLNFMIRKFIK